MKEKNKWHIQSTVVLKDLTTTWHSFLILMWSEYVYHLSVYFRIIIFHFLLMLFSFYPIEIIYIKFNFSFCVNYDLDKKMEKTIEF